MAGRFISQALTSWKCTVVVVLTVNVAFFATLIPILWTKTYDAQERSVPWALRFTVLDFLNLTRESFAEGSRLESYNVNWEETRRSETIPALHLGLKQLAVAPQRDHSMSVIDLLDDPEAGTTLIQNFRLQENRIVVLNSSIYYMHTTVLYNVTSSDGARLELEFLKTNSYGSLQTLTRTSNWCSGRQLCSLTLGGTFGLFVHERLHFEANYIQFIIGAIPNSHTTLVHVMGK